MSDEPQPLRLRARPPSAEGLPPAPGPPGEPPPAQEPGADQGEATSRLRLKPRLNLSADAPAQAAPAEAVPAPFVPPPPPPSVGIPLPEPVVEAEPEPDDAPKFKLRPKSAPPPPPQPGAIAAGLPPPPPPDVAGLPPPPPPEAGGTGLAPPPLPVSLEGEPVPLPERSASSLPPMSILAAPLPPAFGAAAEAPPPPAPVPRLSLSATADKPPAPKGALGRMAAKLPKIGGKPAVAAKPVKKGAVLRRRAALGPMAKVGLTVVFIGIAVGGFYSYRIFFPEQAPMVNIRLTPVPKPVVPGDMGKLAADALSKVSAAPGQLIDKGKDAIGAQRGQEQAKVDAIANGQDEPTATPTPTPVTDVTESVLGEASISKDVKVSATPLDAAPAASAAFREFVAGAAIGGVYQGSPSKALINGTIVREGQVIDSPLGIAFQRIDAEKKVIYFKDYTGAVVSKNY